MSKPKMTKPKTKRPAWLIAVILLVSAGISAAFIPWDAAFAWFAPLPATVQEEVANAPGRGFDGIIVYVDRKGRPPEFYAAGVRDRISKAPTDPHALFKIASISKLYIAAATAKLVAARRLSLDDTLAHLLPEYAGRIQNADTITLRMMLQHRSGIPNFIESRAFRYDVPQTDDYLLGLVLDKPADFKPGSRKHYSNTNYLLIGRILDKTLGYSHHTYIKQMILTPLGLTHTFADMSEVNPADVMSGYAIGYDSDMKPLNFTAPGGSMIATADDVAVFLRALNDGSLLNDEEHAIYSSVYDYDHTGLLPGYQSIARYHKDIDAVVIQFTSTSGGNAWMKSDIIYHRIVRILRKS